MASPIDCIDLGGARNLMLVLIRLPEPFGVLLKMVCNRITGILGNMLPVESLTKSDVN